MMPSEAEVKRFVAPTMSRALELVRDEMGPEAIIISSKKVSEGIEILTSIDLDLPTRGIGDRRTFGQNFDADVDRAMDSDSSWQSQAGIEKAAENYPGQVEINAPEKENAKSFGADIAAEIERAREKMIAAKKIAEQNTKFGVDSERAIRSSSATQKQTRLPIDKIEVRASRHGVLQSKNEASENLDSLRAEIADLRMVLQQQIWNEKPAQPNLAKPSLDGFEVPDEPRSGAASRHGLTASMPENSVLLTHLQRLDLSKTLTQTLHQRSDPARRISENWKSALGQLSQSISLAENLHTDHGGIFAMLGSTGVGKTTTLAKLAARYSLKHGPGKVALVSMDMHRVGAMEQMRSFGRIIEAPVRTVNENNSLMTVLSSLRDFPLILIDTAGYRHGDAKLKQQQAQLDENPHVRRILVLSCLSQYQSLKASVHAYRQRSGIDACVLSKLDEALSLGEILSVVVEHQQDVAYVTDGQQIPKDIHIASRHSLVASAVNMARQNHELSSNAI